MVKSGLTDMDKIFVTVALWLSAFSVFFVAITLPMLDDMVAIFYNTELLQAEYSSKYYNLVLPLTSLIPATIILVAAALKKRNKMRNNFISIIILGIMLAVCMSGIVIFGISKQLDTRVPITNPIDGINHIDVHVFISLSVCAVLSVVSSGLPLVFHSRRFAARAAKRGIFTTFLSRWLSVYWNVGAYGFLLTAIACSFISGAYAYIPLALFTVVMLITAPTCAYREIKHSAEIELYDMLEMRD